MMLVGSGVRRGGGPHRMLGAAGIHSAERAQWGQNGALRNACCAGEAAVDGVTEYEGRPRGVRHPVAWVLPQKAGSLTVYERLVGVGAFTGLIAGGVNVEAALSGVGTLDPDLLLVGYLAAALSGDGGLDGDLAAVAVLVATIAGVGEVDGTLTAALAAVAALSGSGAISNADARAVLEALAALTGTGSLTGGLVGAGQMSGGLAGSGVISAADAIMVVQAVAALTGTGSLASTLAAIGHAVAAITGAGTFTATSVGVGEMGADLVICDTGSELTAADIASAVWDAIAAAYSGPGTFGELVQTTVGVDYDRIRREVEQRVAPHVWAARK